jgi:hypothetical protein
LHAADEGSKAGYSGIKDSDGRYIASLSDAILAPNRAAVGDAPPRSALTLVYRYVSSGLTGTLTDRVDLATSAYFETRDLSGVL